MAKLPKPFDAKAVEIEQALSQGKERRMEGIAALVEALQRGDASASLQSLAAEQILTLSTKTNSGTKSKGRPRNEPKLWPQIVADYDELISDGWSDLDAKMEIAERHGVSEGHVTNCIYFAKQGKDHA